VFEHRCADWESGCGVWTGRGLVDSTPALSAGIYAFLSPRLSQRDATRQARGGLGFGCTVLLVKPHGEGLACQLRGGPAGEGQPVLHRTAGLFGQRMGATGSVSQPRLARCWQDGLPVMTSLHQTRPA